MRVRIHASVLEGMRNEARRYSSETGGLLVGPDLETISELIPSGRAAYRTHSEYELDPEYLQPLLDDAQRRGLRFLGVWHVHPEGCVELSRTDLGTARRMLLGRAYGVDRLFMPLTVRCGSSLETRFLAVEGKAPSVNEVSVTVIHEERHEWRDGAHLCARYAPGSRMTPAAKPPCPRQVVERQAPEDAGWVVESLDCEATASKRVNKSDTTLCALPPVASPHISPEILVENEDGRVHVAYDLRSEAGVRPRERSPVAVGRQAERAVDAIRVARGLSTFPLRRLAHATTHFMRSGRHGE